MEVPPGITEENVLSMVLEGEEEMEKEVIDDTDKPGFVPVTKPLIDPALNACWLLWQGELPKRTFHGFKFQVSYMLVNFW